MAYTWKSSWGTEDATLDGAHDAYVRASQGYDPSDEGAHQEMLDAVTTFVAALDNAAGAFTGTDDFKYYREEVRDGIRRFTDLVAGAKH
jgi:hypothetical protein